MNNSSQTVIVLVAMVIGLAVAAFVGYKTVMTFIRYKRRVFIDEGVRHLCSVKSGAINTWGPIKPESEQEFRHQLKGYPNIKLTYNSEHKMLMTERTHKK